MYKYVDRKVRMRSANLLIQILLFKVTFLTTKQNSFHTVNPEDSGICHNVMCLEHRILVLVNGNTVRLLLELSQQCVTGLRSWGLFLCLNTLRTGDADLRF